VVVYKGSYLTPRVGLELIDFNQPPGLSVALPFLGCPVNKLFCFWWWGAGALAKKVGQGALLLNITKYLQRS